jgi:hypothetical protein
LYAHPLGWELKLMVGELGGLVAGPVRSQVCRSSEEVLINQDTWNGAMIERGGRSEC